MATREQVLQAVRAWLIHTTGLLGAKVVIAGDDAPRPAMPYLTVLPLSLHARIGTDEVKYVDAGVTQTEAGVGDRRGSVQVAGFGTDVADLLDRAALSVGLPTAAAVLTALGTGVSVYGTTAPLDRAQLRDTGFEMSAVMDVMVTYRTSTTPVTSPHAETLEYEIAIESDPTPPPDLDLEGSVSAI